MLKYITRQKSKNILSLRIDAGRVANTMTTINKTQRAIVLKTPKGMRDLNGRESALMQEILRTAEKVFQKNGAVSIDTPIMELKEVLQNKYGEDTKLIYDLADQGGELCSLRYDLTVPLARFCAQHAVSKIKRYQYGKVYRRDQPNVSQGRLREFYQCDFDIVGTYDPMVPELECINTIISILSALKIEKFILKINNRILIDGIFEIAGVPAAMTNAVCSSIDKLDKKTWEEVEEEIVNVKGISREIALKIKKYVVNNSGPVDEICEFLASDPEIVKNQTSFNGLSQMKLLSEYLKACSSRNLHNIKFDLSLARGLDYYTGVIFEAIIVDDDPKAPKSLGSVAGGGRYDNLIKSLSNYDVCCIGFSLGCERIYSYLRSKLDIYTFKPNTVDVLVVNVGKADFKEVINLCNEFREAGISAENLMKSGANLQGCFAYCERDKIPFIIIVGEKELSSGIFSVKCVDKSCSLNNLFPNVSFSRTELAPNLIKIIDAYRSYHNSSFGTML